MVQGLDEGDIDEVRQKILSDPEDDMLDDNESEEEL